MLQGQLGFMPSRSVKSGQGIMGSARGFNSQGIMDSARGFVVFVFLFVSILLPEVACGSRYYSSGRQMIVVVPAPFPPFPPPPGLAPDEPQPGNPAPFPSPPFPPPPVLPSPPPPVLPSPPPPVLPSSPPPVPPPPAPVQGTPPPAGSDKNSPPPAMVLPPPPVEFPPPPAVESFPPPTIVTPGDTWNESEKAGVVIASIAASLQVAVVVFLLVKRHQMLTTVEYDDIDDLEYDTPRSDNPDFRHVDSA